MRHLSLAFFGGFHVLLDGAPVNTFESDKVRALLAYLAVENEYPQRRASLAALFWPELSEKKAAHNLSQTLLRLRVALQDDRGPNGAPAQPFLLINRQEIQLNPASRIQLDIRAFTGLLKSCEQHHPKDRAGMLGCSECVRAMQAAIDLYQGDLLAGLFVRGCPGIEQWRIVQQEALQMQAVNVLEQLANHHERLCEYDQVQKYAHRLATLDPWCEDAHLQLMRAQAAKGQVLAALEHFETYRRNLAEELGVEPSQNAQHLYQQIRLGAVLQNSQLPLAEATRPLVAQAELRQVTALVCSRCAPINADPEDQYHQLLSCRQGCAEILKRYGGHLAQRQGNQCLVYYGYPLAYEDAAQRAVYAGLAMVAANPDDPVQVSIHTGMLVAGEPRGRRLQDRELIGEAPHVARGIHRLAQPGQVLISQDVDRLVAGWFDSQPGAAPFVTDSGESLRIYVARMKSEVARPIAALSSAGLLSPFVGRDAEIRQALSCLEKSAQGKGQVVLVRGISGIGKSRLVWEVQQYAAPARWVWTRCTQFDQNIGLAPLKQIIEQLLDVQPRDSLSDRQQRVENGLAQIFPDKPATARMIAMLMGLPVGPVATQPTHSRMRELLQTAVIRFLQRMAARTPLVLVIEDLQWSDTETIDWIIEAFNVIGSIACTILLTARNNFDPPWLYQHPMNRLDLAPLNPAQAALLAAGAAAPDALPGWLESCVDRAEGIPLYLEELARQPSGAGQSLPPALRDLLVSRLDYLGPARYTVNWAAMLGRIFSRQELQAAAEMESTRLQHDLKTLLDAGIIAPVEGSAHEVYTFQHALLQEAARASLLRITRVEYEQRIAAVRSIPAGG